MPPSAVRALLTLHQTLRFKHRINCTWSGGKGRPLCELSGRIQGTFVFLILTSPDVVKYSGKEMPTSDLVRLIAL